jgi:hypothetical protein
MDENHILFSKLIQENGFLIFWIMTEEIFYATCLNCDIAYNVEPLDLASAAFK